MLTSNWLSFAAILVALAGWAYQLGVMNSRVVENSRALRELQDRMTQHHEDVSKHTSDEWRAELRLTLHRLEAKIDQLPCKVPEFCRAQGGGT
jgi:hypothetical protein